MKHYVQKYDCPNCGISVLFHNPNCQNHVSPLVGRVEKEDSEPYTPRKNRERGERQIYASDVEAITKVFVTTFRVPLEEMQDARRNIRTLYYRRLLAYVMHHHCIVEGRPVTFKLICKQIALSNVSTQTDVSKFSELLKHKPEIENDISRILDELEKAFA